MGQQMHGLNNSAEAKPERPHIAQSVVEQTEFIKLHCACLFLMDVAPIVIIVVFVLVR